MYLEEYQVGKKYYVKEAQITSEEIKSFSKKYDNRPFHQDENDSTNPVFNGLVASGFNTLCFAWSKWVDMEIDSKGVLAGIGIDNLRWLQPVYPGDILSSVCTVTGKKRSSNKKTGTVYFNYQTKNQNGDLVLSFDSIVLVKSKIYDE